MLLLSPAFLAINFMEVAFYARPDEEHSMSAGLVHPPVIIYLVAVV